MFSWLTDVLKLMTYTGIRHVIIHAKKADTGCSTLLGVKSRFQTCIYFSMLMEILFLYKNKILLYRMLPLPTLCNALNTHNDYNNMRVSA